MLLSSYLTEDINSSVGLFVCFLWKLLNSIGKFGGEGWGAIWTLIPEPGLDLKSVTLRPDEILEKMREEKKKVFKSLQRQNF